MSDFDLGYLYYLHDKIQESKDIESSGSSLISSGTTMVIIAVIFAYFFGAWLLLFGLAGLGMVYAGMRRHDMVEHLHLSAEKGKVNIELHHNEVGPVHMLRPSIIRSHISRNFSDELSEHAKEKDKISRLVMENSGLNINALYKLYKSSGGTYNPEHFVYSLHSLKRHGLVTVKKSAA